MSTTKKCIRLLAGLALYGLCVSVVHAVAITVPGTFESTEGDSNNAYPFNIGGTPAPQPSMRYQQIYSASEFSAGGVIDEIRFRVDGSDSSFSQTGIDVRIDLAYAATTVATASAVFANNIGTGLETVLDTSNLSLSGTGGPGPNPFDIVIDVVNLFVYDPTQGDLLMDVYMRNSPSTEIFDAANSSVMSRIYTFPGDVNAASGTLDISSGLVTQFEVVPEPTSVALLGIGLASFVFARKRTAA